MVLRTRGGCSCVALYHYAICRKQVDQSRTQNLNVSLFALALPPIQPTASQTPSNSHMGSDEREFAPALMGSLPLMGSLLEALAASPLHAALADELEVLQAIWGDEGVLSSYADGAPWSSAQTSPLRLLLDSKLGHTTSLRIHISIPANYPASPPLLQLADVYLGSFAIDDDLVSRVMRCYSHDATDGRSREAHEPDSVEFRAGEVCIYEGVEWVKQICQEFMLAQEQKREGMELIRSKVQECRIDAPAMSDVEETPGQVFVSPTHLEARRPCPEIISGEPLTDRRSVFVGHCARISSPDDVGAPLACDSALTLCNRSSSCSRRCSSTSGSRRRRSSPRRSLLDAAYAQHRHNISAYTVVTPDGVLHHDNDDDGESAAGGRLANLLNLLDVADVVVVVSRWYGGINLGADRFKHINSVARDVLLAGGFLDPLRQTAKLRKR